jgi:hypothetical protein
MTRQPSTLIPAATSFMRGGALLALVGVMTGALIWVVLPWATPIALVLPFVLGLLPSKRAVFWLAGGYYAGALSFLPVLALSPSATVGAAVGMLVIWLFGALMAGALWSLGLDPKGRPLHTGVRMLVVWFIALFTPLGLFGFAHPLWGWAFAGDGFMGVASLVVAPLLTCFLVLAMLHQRHGGTSPWSWHSGRVLSLALCAVLIGKGIGDHTRVSSQAGQAVGLQSKWGPLQGGQAPSLEERLERVKKALRELSPVQGVQPLVSVLLTGQGAFGELPPQPLLASEDRRGITVGLGGTVSSLPAVMLLPEGGEARVVCSAFLPSLLYAWVVPSNACMGDSRVLAVPVGGAASQSLRVLMGDEALFGGFQVLEQLVRPRQSLALVTTVQDRAGVPGHTVQIKHFKAMSLLTKTPHLLATNQLVAID